jgi:hypothetical protein
LPAAVSPTALIVLLPPPLSPSSCHHCRCQAAIIEPSPPTPPLSCRRRQAANILELLLPLSHFVRDACPLGNGSC